jgi:hypothetical protein
MGRVSRKTVASEELRMKSMILNQILSACALFVLLLLPSTGYPQKLDQDFLNCAVLIHYRTDETHEKRGSGFIIVREVSPDPNDLPPENSTSWF